MVPQPVVSNPGLLGKKTQGHNHHQPPLPPKKDSMGMNIPHQVIGKIYFQMTLGDGADMGIAGTLLWTHKLYSREAFIRVPQTPSSQGQFSLKCSNNPKMPENRAAGASYVKSALPKKTKTTRELNTGFSEV